MVRKQRKEREGYVVSQKADKSPVIAITRKVKHPLYRKIITKTTRLMIHDPDNRCQVGDRVRAMESRPMSKKKRWCLGAVLTKDDTKRNKA